MNNLFNVNFVAFAEQLGEALGRGVARGISGGFNTVKPSASASPLASTPTKRRGRPPRAAAVAAGGERPCKTDGCSSPARSKGLCSKHYQAARRKVLARA